MIDQKNRNLEILANSVAAFIEKNKTKAGNQSSGGSAEPDPDSEQNSENGVQGQESNKLDYKEGVISYWRSSPAYAFCEGIGAAGGYIVSGSIIIRKISRSKFYHYTARISASGQTPQIGIDRSVRFFADVEVIVDGKIVASYPLFRPKGDHIGSPDKYFIGVAEFNLPNYNDKVEIRITGGYTYHYGDNRCTPEPHTISTTIKITK